MSGVSECSEFCSSEKNMPESEESELLQEREIPYEGEPLAENTHERSTHYDDEEERDFNSLKFYDEPVSSTRP